MTMNLSIPQHCQYIPLYGILHDLADIGLIDAENVTFRGCLPECGICDHPLQNGDMYYSVYNLIVIGALLPIIGCLGLVGNGLSAFVYSRQEMRGSTNLYLCALGCSDSAVIITGIFLFCIDSIRKYSLNLTRLFAILSPIVYPMGMTAQTCSVYFTLCAGADCFAQVCLPEKAKKYVARLSFVRGSVIFVILFSVIYNIPHCFEAVVIDCFNPQHEEYSWELCPSVMRFDIQYMEVYYKYMYATFLAVGPLVILVILNTFIIGVSVFGSGGTSMGDTISLVLVVLLFIACNVAALLLNTLEDVITDILGPKINYIVDLSNVLVVFNSSFNFIIYFIFSDSFRNTLLLYAGVRKVKKERIGPGPPIVVTERQTRSKQCKDTLGRLLAASQPEVLI